MKDRGSTIAEISAAVASFVNLYNHVDLLLNDMKFKLEPVAMELQADLRLLPTLITQILPSLNTGSSDHHDRNFYRVLKLMCKALEEARDSLDEYMISVNAVSILIKQSPRDLNLRLAESRSRIKHAVTLYNAYCCNKGAPTFSNPMQAPMAGNYRNVLRGDLMNIWECLNELEQDYKDREPIHGPCPKRILKAVAKLRAKTVCRDDVEKWGEEEMEHFCRAGGLEALISLLSSSNSQCVQMQALKYLGTIVAVYNEDMKKRISIIHDPSAVELLGSVIATSGGDHVLSEAVALMRAMMRNNNEIDVKKAWQPGTMVALLKLLFCSPSSFEVQANTLGVLWEFSIYEEYRCKIVNCSMNINSDALLERLVLLCSSSSSLPVIEFFAAALLQNLCMDKNIKTKVLSIAGLSERLCNLIESFDNCYHKSSVVQQIQAFKRVEYLNSPMAIGFSVSMLDSDSEIQQIRGLDLLMLGFSQSLVDLAASEGAISRVIGLLKSGSTPVLEKATEALYMLSVPEENEVRIASNHITIQRLVALVEYQDSWTVRANAVKVLESLSFNPNNREKILKEHRSVEKVAALLFHESFAAQSSASSLLWNLSTSSMANKIRIASIYGLPQRLSDLLLSDSPVVQEKAAGAIMSLSYNGRSRKMIASIACTFERLIKLLDSVSTLVHQNAAGALYNLSISPDNIAAIGAHPRAVANLVNLLCSKCDLVQEYAAGALGNLTLMEEMREAMKQMGAMPLLKKLKHSSSSASARTQAKRALENLMV